MGEFDHINEDWLLEKMKPILERGGDVRIIDVSMDIDLVAPRSVEAILLRAILMELRSMRRSLRRSEPVEPGC